MSDAQAAKRPRLAEGYGFGLAGRMSAGALQQARHLASHTPHMACPGFDVGLASRMSARSLQQEQHDAAAGGDVERLQSAPLVDLA